MAVTTHYREIDLSGGLTEEKILSNFMALAGDGDVKGVFHVTATGIDVGNLVDAAGATSSITVSGVDLGDEVIGVSFGVDFVDMVLTAYVQSADTVEIRVQNESGSTHDLASTSVTMTILDKT